MITMCRLTISGPYSFIIIALTTIVFRYVVHVKTYQYQQSLDNYTESKYNSTKVFNEFYPLARKDGSNWTTPLFRYNNYDNLKFCRNNDVSRVPVSSHAKSTTIPCWTTYGGSFNSITDILVYKGTPGTNLTLISGQNSRILGFDEHVGFRYNLTGDDDYLGYYTCFIDNSSRKNYVITELYRDDNAASVYSSDCSVVYSVNNIGTFFCIVEGSTSSVAFEWGFKMNDGEEISCKPYQRRKKKVNNNDGTVQEMVRIQLPNSDVVGIVCRARELGSVFQGLQRVVMKELRVPEVLDNKTVTLSLEDGSSLSLNCSFKIGDSSSNFVFWLINGTKYNGSYGMNWSLPIGTTILDGIYVTSNMTNYTCVAKNILGFSSKTFLVSRKVREMQSGRSVYTFAVPVVTSTVVLLLLIIEWKRRTAYILKFLMQVRLLKFQDPSSSSSMIVLDPGSGEPLAKGVHGEVWETTVAYRNTDIKHKAVLKTFIGTPFLSILAAELLFDDLINEIRICQKLNRNDGCPYIVRYMGLHAPSVQRFQVYLVLEYCHPGQLLNLVREHVAKDDNDGDDFLDDVDEISIEERRRLELDHSYKYLAMTHLIRWAYQIAQAVKFLHDNNIVHRDLAARNILLKGPTYDDDYTSYDQVNALLADFGMSRFVQEDNGPYIVNQDTPIPRNIPKFWYPPESFGDEVGVQYTKKSDVWSFGVLLWEMFSLGLTPNGVMGYDCTASDLKQELIRGKRLERDSLKSIPDEMWTLMQDCWKHDPSERPDFSVICQRLESLNDSLGLSEQRDVNQGQMGEENLGGSQDNSGEDDEYFGSTLNLISNQKNHVDISSNNSCVLHTVHH